MGGFSGWFGGCQNQDFQDGRIFRMGRSKHLRPFGYAQGRPARRRATRLVNFACSICSICSICTVPKLEGERSGFGNSPSASALKLLYACSICPVSALTAPVLGRFAEKPDARVLSDAWSKRSSALGIVRDRIGLRLLAREVMSIIVSGHSCSCQGVRGCQGLFIVHEPRIVIPSRPFPPFLLSTAERSRRAALSRR